MDAQEDQEDQAEPKNNEGEQVSVQLTVWFRFVTSMSVKVAQLWKINSKINSPTSVLFVMRDVCLLGEKNELRHTVTYNLTES